MLWILLSFPLKVMLKYAPKINYFLVEHSSSISKTMMKSKFLLLNNTKDLPSKKYFLTQAQPRWYYNCIKKNVGNYQTTTINNSFVLFNAKIHHEWHSNLTLYDDIFHIVERV